MSARGFPLLEVGKHRAPGDAWVVVDNRILDVSAFAPQHPGGADILLACAGGDVTREFLDVGHSSDARQRLASLEIGVVRPPTAAEEAEEAAAAESKDAAGEAVYLVGTGTCASGASTAGGYWAAKKGSVDGALADVTRRVCAAMPSPALTGVALGIAVAAVMYARRTIPFRGG